MSAPEKRREKRYRRRLRVVFEADGTRAGGYTTNLSARGMQVASAVVFPMGSEITGKVELPDGGELTLTAKVRWARKTQGTFSIMREKSMGLQVVGPMPPELLRLLEGAREDTSRIPETMSAPPGRVATPPPLGAVPRDPDPPFRRPRPPTPAPVGSASGSRPAAAAAPAPRPVAPDPKPAERRPVRATPAPSTPGGGLVIGLEGDAELAITAPDSAAGLAPFVTLVEQAAEAAIADRVPADLQGRALDLSLTIMDGEPLPVGSSVQAKARVLEITGNGRFVKLSVELSEMGRPLATATHTRVLVRRRPS